MDSISPQPGSKTRQQRTDAPRKELKVLTKLGYGVGEIAEGVKSTALETFLFFYYVQVVGLPGTLTGLALMLALLSDGVTDPLVGSLSDNFRSRIGRRHPFLYAAPIPVALFLFLLFTPPQEATDAVLFAWLLVFTILTRFMQTFYFVPHMALGAELSDDFQERVSIGGYRSTFAFVGRILCLAMAFTFFFQASEQWPNGQLNPGAYGPFALSCGLMVVVSIVFSALATQRRALKVYRLNIERNPGGHQRSGFLNGLRQAFTLRAFIIYFAALLVSYILGGIQAALSLHLYTYYWEISPSDMRTVFISNAVGFMVGIGLARALANRFDKKRVYIGCTVSSVGLQTVPIILSLLGVFQPDSQAQLVLLLVTATFMAGVAGGPAFAVAAAMLADVADAYEAKFGGRLEGLLFGTISFSRKASLGFGGAVAGVALDIIRFPAGASVSEVPASAVRDLAVLVGPAMFVIILISQAIMAFYPLSRMAHSDILAELHSRDRSGPG